MAHFVTERLSTYYERRLLDYANYRQPRLLTKKFPTYDGQRIALISADMYEIESSRTEGLCYTVNIAACLCTCYEGATGKFCKHIHYVQTERGLNCLEYYHLGEQRELIYFVVCGSAPPPGWLMTLHGRPELGPNARSLHAAAGNSNAFETAGSYRLSTYVDPDIHSKLLAKQTEFSELWKARIDSHAEHSAVELLAAYEVAVSTLHGIRTANAAVSVVHTLGKYLEKHTAVPRQSNQARLHQG